MSAIPAVEYSTRIHESEMRLTPTAQAKIAELLAEAEDDVAGIRVFVSGGGCGGMTYGMTYADRAADDYDGVIEGPGFRVFVDPVALNYLQGCEIDFRVDGPSPSFVFNKVFQAVGGSGRCGGCGGGCGA
ncbi:MAG: iron-sulfur cluster assembly accessory protein [Gammaproteobacteria bacterium]|nr:iron-sulfur cluster assembly accessory protein [Gammaproteobacteria bacterium]